MNCIAATCRAEAPLINELSEHDSPVPPGNPLISAGAVIAVLLGFPSFFIGLFGAVGLITGEKLIAGALGALWGYLAVAGAYELNRRKFDWQRGKRYSDRHLFAGTLAVSVGLVVSGAMHETMPALAIVPALSAVKQAGDGHDTRALSVLHLASLGAGIAIGSWFYADGVIGKVLMERIGALP